MNLCPLCNSDPCICGNGYNDLTVDGMLNLLSTIKKVCLHKKIDVSISVEGTEIDTYLANKEVKVEAVVGSLYTKLKSVVELPVKYDKWCNKHLGEEVMPLLAEINENPPCLRFPLLIAIAKTCDRPQLTILARTLWKIYMDYILPDVNFVTNFIKADPTKIANSDIDTIKIKLYQLAAELRLQLKDSENRGIIDRYITGAILIQQILESDTDLILRALKFMTLTVENSDEILEIYSKNGLINPIADALYNCDIMFAQALLTNSVILCGNQKL